jgi:hypothetical protein
MECNYASTRSDGQLEIPVAMRSSMGMMTGGSLWIQLDASKIVKDVEAKPAKERGLSE